MLGSQGDSAVRSAFRSFRTQARKGPERSSRLRVCESLASFGCSLFRLQDPELGDVAPVDEIDKIDKAAGSAIHSNIIEALQSEGLERVLRPTPALS
jgi:hypothetical protein